MMVQLLQTPAIFRAVEYLDSRGELSDLGVGSPDRSRNITNNALPISHETVIRISQRIQELSLTSTPDEMLALPRYHLDDLLRGSRIYIEPPKPKAEPVSPLPPNYSQPIAHFADLRVQGLDGTSSTRGRGPAI